MFERRTPDIVRIQGRDLPKLLGQEINSIRIMAFRSGKWAPIPFQIDEKNATAHTANGGVSARGTRSHLQRCGRRTSTAT